MADPARTTLTLPNPEATDLLAARLAGCLGAGDCLLLEGDLGAGKSHLARGIIQTLQARHGHVEDVPSPTYTIVQTYAAGDLAILHADLYRIGDASELEELGLDEALGTALCLIEWPDRLESVPQGALTISISLDGAGRRAVLSGPASAWGARLAPLEQAFA